MAAGRDLARSGAQVTSSSSSTSRTWAYLLDDVRLVVSELVTNAAVHARTRIRVKIEEMAFCVKLTVYDQSADVPVRSLASRVGADDESGRGLWIVDAVQR